MKKQSVGTNEVISYGTLKSYVPTSTRASSSLTKSMNFVSLKHELVLSPSNKEAVYPLRTNQDSLNRPVQSRYELVLDENGARKQHHQQEKPVSATQTLSLGLGSPKGSQKIKLIEEKKAAGEGNHSRLNYQNSSIVSSSTTITATNTNASNTSNVRGSFANENIPAKRNGLEINTEFNNVRYATLNLGANTTVARSQTLKPKDTNETHEGSLKKNTVSSYTFVLNTKFSSQKGGSIRPNSASISLDKAKLQAPTSNQTNSRSGNPNQKCHTLEDEQENPRKGFFARFFTKTSPKNMVTSSTVQKIKNENSHEVVSRSQNNLKLNSYFLPSGQNNASQNKSSRTKDGEEESLDVVAQECDAQYAGEAENRASQNLRQSIQLVRNSVGIRTEKSSFAKEGKSNTLKQHSGKFFDDENNPNGRQQAQGGEKVSLNSFVTKVSKGNEIVSVTC